MVLGHSRVKSKKHSLDVAWPRRRRTRQESTPHGRRVAHVDVLGNGIREVVPVPDEEEAVAVLLHSRGPIAPDERTSGAGARGRTGKEGRGGAESVVGGVDAGELPREEVGKEEAVGVDDGAPRAADAAGLGEGAAGEAAEDVDEHVVGEADAVGIIVGIHGAGHTWWLDAIYRRYGGDICYAKQIKRIYCSLYGQVKNTCRIHVIFLCVRDIIAIAD
jgi:hypothetical protein